MRCSTSSLGFLLLASRLCAGPLEPDYGTLTLGVDAPPAPLRVDGLAVLLGNDAGQYRYEQDFPVATNVVASNIDWTLPWHVAACWFVTNAQPAVKCAGSNGPCRTNWTALGPACPELLVATPEMRLRVSVGSALATASWWAGQGTNYALLEGPTPFQATNVAAVLTGTNGVAEWAEPATNSRFYRLRTAEGP